MSHGALQTPAPPPGHPYAAEIEAERRGWYELVDLVRSLTPEECLEPGYYRDPDWTVRDVVTHLGTWLAEAQIQFQRIGAGTYGGHDVDVEALNAAFLEAMRDQPWDVAWVQAQAGRSRMVAEWYALDEPTDEAAWWIRKSGGNHFAEHLGRLHEWAGTLIARRTPDDHGGWLDWGADRAAPMESQARGANVSVTGGAASTVRSDAG